MDESKIAKLERLAALFKEGMLTEAEFNEQKRDVLDGAAKSGSDATVVQPDVERPSDIESNNYVSNQTPVATTVLFAIDETYLTPTFESSSGYYSQKFHKIVSKADIGNLDISGSLNSIKAKIQRTTSFNLWGLLFGPLWGCYRRLRSAWVIVYLIAIYGACEIMLDFSFPSVDRGITIGGAVLFGIFGNSFLLSKYLQQFSVVSDVFDIRRKIAPSYLAPLIAIAILLAPYLVDEMLRISGVRQNISPASDISELVSADGNNTESTSEWQSFEGEDPISGKSLHVAYRTFDHQFRTAFELKCEGGEKLIYQFTAFDLSDNPEPFRTKLTWGGNLATPIGIRTSEDVVMNTSRVPADYQNRIAIEDPSYNMVDKIFKLAKSDRLRFRLALVSGEQIIEIDQTDPVVASVINPCIKSIEALATAKDAEQKPELQSFEAVDYRNSDSVDSSSNDVEIEQSEQSTTESKSNLEGRQRPNPIPKGNPINWANGSDYPAEALKFKYEGVTSFRVTVGANGRVTGCHIVESSGHRELDEATCSNVSRRARFDPALDEDGNATSGTYSNRVSWSLP